MKKIILSAAIIIASMTAGLSASAKSNNGTTTDSTKKECTRGERGDRQDRYMQQFEGLNLTDAQRSQLEAIRPEKAGRPEKKDGEKPQELTKEQRQAMREQARAERTKRVTDFLAQVKAILTPEQYTQFLENSYVSARDHKQGKGGKHGNKQSKPGKQGGESAAKKGKTPKNS